MGLPANDNRVLGKRIISQLVGGIRDRMKLDLVKYRQTGNTDYLQNILTLPERRRSRINNCIAEIGQPALVALIDAYGVNTAAEMNTELTTLENQCVALKAQLDSGTTWADLADIIEAGLEMGPLEKIAKYFQYEPNFTDMFGEVYNPQP